ncbi:hypothetical protein EV659_10891 [Rhodothalassium salexigens DSM 2132]|uniref:Uncharacterized protein n=1 Tax=Rhodothalassium salexigens DSM 2132 TaxID=1188247 RepID=A0A4R2PCY1_RHOSA|nr:hypothetical protein [Rhodothalassium salexigens]MBB4212118.1 tetratricopeptide (TPR) repeat protein [Rhodothalassium salexigens DSM 2132]TCP32992.1 hypothetical protein EV659_10891 [Rhodothalassium salexigens DSM 2132]
MAIWLWGPAAFASPPPDITVKRPPETRPGGPHVVEDQAGARRYQACIKAARKRPGEGLSLAESWAAEADAPAGAPDHCAAVALVGLEDFATAAARFDAATGQIRASNGLLSRLDPDSGDLKLLLSGVLSQAGNAWLMAGDADTAAERFDAALALLPDRERLARLELLVDRARAAAAAGAFDLAARALDDALALDADRLDVRLYRATARRHLGALDRAEDDVAEVIDGRPEWGPAWLEKGNIRARMGDLDGARSAWHQVLRVEQDTAAAQAARNNLDRLDPAIGVLPESPTARPSTPKAPERGAETPE